MPDDGHVEQRDQSGRKQHEARPVEANAADRLRGALAGSAGPAPGQQGKKGCGSRKIERQPKVCSRMPPMLGPIAGTSTMPKPKMPIALPRRSGGKTSNRAIIASGCSDAGGRTLQHARCNQRLGTPARRAEHRRGEEKRQGDGERSALPERFDQPRGRQHRGGRRREESRRDPLQRIVADVEFA